MDPSIQRFLEERQLEWSRRTFLGKSAQALGTLALGSLLNPALLRGMTAPSPRWSGIVTSPAFPPTAKRIIHLYMAGGPSHIDLFDPKPELNRINGHPFPASFTSGQQLAQLQGSKLLARGSKFGVTRCGLSGQMISDLLPYTQQIADDICIVRSMHTEQINHDPAHAFMNSGSGLKGRPSIGSWLLYGLGSESDNLPGFVVLMSRGPSGGEQPVSARQWSSGFLPSRFQGVQFQSTGAPVHYVGNPDGVCQSTQRQVIDEVARLNGFHEEQTQDPEIQTRIAQYELAFKMQSSIPDLTDLSEEPQSIRDMYGVKHQGDGSFASNCLIARRLAERGVRFIQLYHRGWDQHSNLDNDLPDVCRRVDQASAALVKDLKQRGMLEDTLVLWGGEFGRTPMGQGSGRDHHINAFSVWMAGGGIRGGLTWGSTDELGYRYIEDGQEMHVHDLHANMLAAMGINHEKLTYRHQGRDFRLTDVHGRISKGIFA
ncbi:MAG TPA: DUF1501 domain-containing protein [Opitutaceae bacterium]|jgi:hypothetical protein